MPMYNNETRDIYTSEFRAAVMRLNQDFTKTINEYNRSELTDIVGFINLDLCQRINMLRMSSCVSLRRRTSIYFRQ